MNAEEIKHLQELITAYKQRLRALQVQAAKLGTNFPPELELEIAETQNQIEKLNSQIETTSIVGYTEARRALMEQQHEIDGIERKLQNAVVVEERTFRIFGIPIFSIVITTTVE